MTERIRRIARKEWKGAVKFLIVGGFSFFIFAGMYALLTRWIFPSADRTWMNFLAICSSAGFNFFAHRGWTYRATQGRQVDQVWRYVLVVITATLLQTFLFWVAVDQIGIFDAYALVPIAGICAVYTYVVHKVFTFKTVL